MGFLYIWYSPFHALNPLPTVVFFEAWLLFRCNHYYLGIGILWAHALKLPKSPFVEQNVYLDTALILIEILKEGFRTTPRDLIFVHGSILFWKSLGKRDEKVLFSSPASPSPSVFPLDSACKMTSSFFSLSRSCKILHLARLTFSAFCLEISLLEYKSFLSTLSNFF